MNPIKFESKDSPMKVWACGKCGKLPGTKALAEVCCNASCATCGDAVKSPYTRCEGCMRDAERQRLARVFERAEKICDYEGPVYDPYFERYFNDTGAMEDWLADEEAPRSPYVHACTTSKPSIDFNDVIEQAEWAMEMDEDFEFDWQGLDELKLEIQMFNEAQTQVMWFMDYKRVIDLTGA